MFYVSACTLRGKERSRNEDSFLIDDDPVSGKEDHRVDKTIESDTSPVLLAVADGMGGHASGEVASRIAVETLAAAFKSEGIAFDALTSILDAHTKICEAARIDGSHRGMGTTIAGLFLWGQEAIIFNVGDSRIYRLNNQEISLMSVDDTFGDSNAITQCLGGQSSIHPKPHILQVRVQVEDSFILVSDGISDVLSSGQIRDAWFLSKSENIAAGVCAAALKNNSTDDTTAVALRHYP
jgi:protein phosphatase